jgi:hypothetical protein
VEVPGAGDDVQERVGVDSRDIHGHDVVEGGVEDEARPDGRVAAVVPKVRDPLAGRVRCGLGSSDDVENAVVVHVRQEDAGHAGEGEVDGVTDERQVLRGRSGGAQRAEREEQARQAATGGDHGVGLVVCRRPAWAGVAPILLARSPAPVHRETAAHGAWPVPARDPGHAGFG